MRDYSRFLHASVGIDVNGMDLRVLSVLARQDLDPWDYSLELSLQAPDEAIRSLSTILRKAGRGASTQPDPATTATATQLLALLPDAPAPPFRDGVTPGSQIPLIVGMTLLMLTLRWWLMEVTVPQPASHHPAAQAAAVAPGSVGERTEAAPGAE